MTDLELNEAVARKLGHPISGGMIALRSTPHEPEYEIPDYCHSIEAAWEIVEHLAGKNIIMQLKTFSSGEANCIFYKILSSDVYSFAPSSAAPRAICEAFLKLR